MIQFPDHMRPMQQGEEDAIDALLRDAFDDPSEARLVQQLRRTKAIAGETVLPMGDRIVGYYALSRMVAPKGWLCLAPVAVARDVQGRRFCTRMMGMLTEWARMSDTYVVVLGKVSLYERGGFSHARTASLTSPYPGSHLMLAGPGSDVPTQTLVYPKPFQDLD